MRRSKSDGQVDGGREMNYAIESERKQRGRKGQLSNAVSKECASLLARQLALQLSTVSVSVQKFEQVQ